MATQWKHSDSTVRTAENTSFTLAAFTLNLRRLCIIRTIVLLCMSAAVVYGYLYLDIASQLTAVTIIIVAQTLLTVSSYWQCRREQAVTEQVFTLQLIADVAFIFALAYFTGGATNPFVSYFLVPLSIAAATLPLRHAAMIALLAVAAYTALLFFYQPLPFFSHSSHMPNDASNMGTEHHQHHSAHNTTPTDTSIVLNAHYLGMWFNFLVSAALIAWFVSRMAEAIRSQQEAINKQREQQIYDEQILSIATLAAGTAHELGTPINSLALLIEELEAGIANSDSNDSALTDDITLMKSQILQCKQSLAKLVRTAQQTQPGERVLLSAADLINNCIDQWQPLRPELKVEKQFDAGTDQMQIECDETLSQAITNLLNNAANASPECIVVRLDAQPNTINISIIDQGKGISDFVLNRFGKQPIAKEQDTLFSKDKQGLGFGLFLSNASIQRHGGQLILRNREALGAEAIITLPFAGKTQ